MNRQQLSNKKNSVVQAMAFTVMRLVNIFIILLLLYIFLFIVIKGIDKVSWEFLSTMPKDGMMGGGILPAIVGTLCLMLGSMLFSFPLGIISGIYIHEYLKNKKIKQFLILTINSLAGVPSIVFGLFGMALFVNKLGFGSSILAGSLTLGILALPLIIKNTEEALKRTDEEVRLNSYALGASQWQTIRKVVLPFSFSDIVTGLILSMGRVSGETAPILFTVAAYFLPKLPSSIFDQVMALPYHLYVLATSGVDIEKSKPIAYGTALVLIVLTLVFNLIANFIRNLKRY